MIVEVATLDDTRLDAYARLTETQLRSRLEPQRALFIAESDKVIERALAGGMEPLSLLMEAKWLDAMRPVIDDITQRWGERVPVFVAPHDELAKLTGFELTRGALGAFRRPPLPSVAEVVKDARRIAVLEDITNHTNVGAIFRSAAALGVDAVLVTPACYDPLYRRAVRVSMGTVFQVPWTRIGEEAHANLPNIDTINPSESAAAGAHPPAPAQEPAGAKARNVSRETSETHAFPARRTTHPTWAETGIPLLHDLGFKTAAFALTDNSVSLDDPALNAEERLALVFGTEGDGLAHDTIARCDYTVRIPMARGVDSLNVAAASAVAFWQLRAR